MPQSEMWGGSMRYVKMLERDQTPVIIHLGDHDPSGIDMTRDILDRMEIFLTHEGYDPCDVRRIALNMDQVRQFNPPPNPAKITDSRFEGYVKRFGRESWELDALEPRLIVELIEKTVLSLRDDDKWNAAVAVQEAGRARLRKMVDDERNRQKKGK